MELSEEALLIEQVHKEEFLWNPDHRDFPKRTKKNLTWKEIAAVVNSDCK